MNKEANNYCSLLSPDLEMAGTADPVDVWLMLEYPMSWKAKVLADNELADATKEWLDRNITELQSLGLKVRPQFIRQPEYDLGTTKLIVATKSSCWSIEGVGYDYLHELTLASSLEQPPAGSEVVSEPLYFVCMNGQRDICCARFGRPVYQELRVQFGDRVWQVSHLGGHRFAPNVLTLPAGDVYGRLTRDDLSEFYTAIEQDELYFDGLRGVAWHDKNVQAAQVFAAQQGLKFVRKEKLESGVTEVIFTDVSSKELSVKVKQADEPIMALASCKDDRPKPVHPYVRA
ncbi:MAG: sucrase ferredoxin [Pseudomonadales bacterium]